MSEKIKLFELEIDSSKLIKELADTSKAIADLQKVQKENTKSTDEERKAYEANAVILKNLRGEYSNNQKVLQALTKTSTQNITTVADARKALSSVSVLWAELTNIYGENSKEANALAEQKLKLTERLKQLESATGDNRRNVGNYTQSLRDAISQTGGLAGSSLKLFDTLKANPIFLLVDILLKLGKAISENQELVDRFTAVWKPLQQVLDFVVGIISEQLIKGLDFLKGAFNDLGGTLKNIGKLIVDNIINRFTAFKVLAEGVVKLFKGDFKGALKSFTDGAAQALTGVEGVTDKLDAAAQAAKRLAEQGKEALDIGGEVDRLRKEAIKLEQQFTATEQERRARIAAIRLEATEGKLATQERIKLLQQAQKLEDQLTSDQQAIAKKRLEAQKLENSTSATNNANKQAELELTNQINALERERDTRKKKLQSEINSANREQLSQDKAAAAERQKLAEEELKAQAKLAEEQVKLFELTNKTRIDDETELTSELVAAEIDRFGKLISLKEDFIKKSAVANKQSEVETQVLLDGLAQQFEDYVAGLTERSAKQGVDKLVDTIKQARLALDRERLDRGLLISPEQVESEKELLRAIAQAEKEALDAKLANNLISQTDYQVELFNLNKRFRDQTAALDLQALTQEQRRDAFEFQSRLQAAQAQGQLSLELRQEQLERQKQIELAAAEALGADKVAIEEKYRILNEQLERAALQNRLQLTVGALTAFAGLVGENTLFGKLAASAATAITTFQSAQAAFAAQQIPGDPSSLPRGIAAAAIATASGLANLVKINKTQVPKPPAARAIPKFGQGGAFEIGGNYHSSGGTDFIGSDGSRFNAEKNEMLFILNRNATSQLKGLSSFNKLFPMASRIGGFQAGGIPPLNGGNAELVSAFREQPIVVDVKDIISETGRRVQLVDSATL
jgi:hypothetical protein